MYTCEVVLKTAQETGESGGISRNHWEIGGIRGNSGEIRGKLGGNSGIVFPPMVKQNSLAGKSISPTSGKNEGKLFHKNSHLGNLCETYAMSDPLYYIPRQWSTMSALILRHNHVEPLIGYQVEPTRLWI